MATAVNAQLVSYLADVHSIEEQALAQMRRAPQLVEGELATAFAQHLKETESQECRVRERLEAYDASPSAVKDLAGRVGGVGMILFARSQPDTPGKLSAHAFSYEHMEVAAYELLARVADRAGDAETATMAIEIAAEERAMAARLADCFDLAVAASLDGDPAAEHLDAYLADAHAIELQSRELLEKGAKIAGAPELGPGLRVAFGRDGRAERAAGAPARGTRLLPLPPEGRRAAAAIAAQWDAALDAA